MVFWSGGNLLLFIVGFLDVLPLPSLALIRPCFETMFAGVVGVHETSSAEISLEMDCLHDGWTTWRKKILKVELACRRQCRVAHVSIVFWSAGKRNNDAMLSHRKDLANYIIYHILMIFSSLDRS